MCVCVCVFTHTQTYICAKLLQLCPTLCDPMDCSLPGSSVHGILQARILEWLAISFSNIYISYLYRKNIILPHTKQQLFPKGSQF